MAGEHLILRQHNPRPCRGRRPVVDDENVGQDVVLFPTECRFRYCYDIYWRSHRMCRLTVTRRGDPAGNARIAARVRKPRRAEAEGRSFQPAIYSAAGPARTDAPWSGPRRELRPGAALKRRRALVDTQGVMDPASGRLL